MNTKSNVNYHVNKFHMRHDIHSGGQWLSRKFTNQR